MSAKKIKARVMFENVFGEVTTGEHHGGGWDKPVFVLPATREAYEQMVEQVGPQIQRWMNGYALPAKYPTVAHAVLAALNIKEPKP